MHVHLQCLPLVDPGKTAPENAGFKCTSRSIPLNIQSFVCLS